VSALRAIRYRLPSRGHRQPVADSVPDTQPQIAEGQSLINPLPSAPITHLATGDYLIDNKVLIERKSVADFAASLLDGTALIAIVLPMK
jgi:hypothetical protein